MFRNAAFTLAALTALAAGPAISAAGPAYSPEQRPDVNFASQSRTSSLTGQIVGETVRKADATISSRSAKRKVPYAYQNPLGVGPNNDSR